MELDHISSFCDLFLKEKPRTIADDLRNLEKNDLTTLSEIESCSDYGTDTETESDNEADYYDELMKDYDSAPPVYEIIDVENIYNFTQIWTSVMTIDEVLRQWKESESTNGVHAMNIQTFEKINYLYNTGFFYVKINPEVSILEFLGLLLKIKIEAMVIPRLNQIPYICIADLFRLVSPDNDNCKIAIQLMVLGNYFKLWELIDPNQYMVNTDETPKLIISGLGTLSIKLYRGYIEHCGQLLSSIKTKLN